MEEFRFYQLHAKLYLAFSQGSLHAQAEHYGCEHNVLTNTRQKCVLSLGFHALPFSIQVRDRAVRDGGW